MANFSMVYLRYSKFFYYIGSKSQFVVINKIEQFITALYGIIIGLN